MTDTLIAKLEARLTETSVSPVDPVERIDTLNELAWELRGSDTPRAHALAKEARELAMDHRHALGQARAARTMAMTVSDAEGLRVIFDLAEEARRLFDEVGDGAGRAASRDFLASIHEHTGDLAGGLELALDALAIAREIDDPVRQGYALSNVGGILAASGEVDLAVERLEEALALFEGAENQDGMTAIWFRLCTVLKNAGRVREALAYAQMCLDATDQDDEFFRCEALTVMAEIEEKRGDTEEAERLYRLSLGALKSEIAKRVTGAETKVALAQLLMRRGALAEAEQELEEALGRVAGEAVTVLAETAAREALAELYERKGELAAAIEQLRAAQALRERMARREARNKLAQVETRAAMDAARKDAEIQKLRFVELHAMQAELVEAEKMALLGKLAAGAAHELNTPLGALLSNADLAATATQRLLSLVRGEEAIGEQAAKLVAVLQSCRETSDEAVERIASIAQSLMRFTELDQAERRPFDVREGLESALALLEPTLSDSIEIERRFDDVPAIEGWPRELNHAFMTVLQNATQAIDGPGLVSVETSATGAHALVRIRDSGRGMSEEQAAHLFDVGWSEEGARTKMRLGLSAAYATVQRHGGTIEVESAVGEGTTVTFRLPIARPREE